MMNLPNSKRLKYTIYKLKYKKIYNDILYISNIKYENLQLMQTKSDNIRSAPSYVSLSGREGNRFVVLRFVRIVRSDVRQYREYSCRVPILMGLRLASLP